MNTHNPQMVARRCAASQEALVSNRFSVIRYPPMTIRVTPLKLSLMVAVILASVS